MRDFNVYIGDDNSPDNIGAIADLFRDRLSISYKKFKNNLGGSDLTAHWQRCIDMAGDEEWLWILPDDDTASIECAETFLQAAKKDLNKEKLYRLQTVHINEENEVIKKTPFCPPLESNTDLIIRKLKFERNSSLAEYIFSKKQFELAGGFTPLPLAWGSDDLLWIALSQNNDIVTLPAGEVSLRQSSLNISNNTVALAQEKFKAKYLFLKIILADGRLMEKIEGTYGTARFKKDISDHLFYEYRSYGLKFLNKRLLTFAFKNNELLGGGLIKNIYRLLRYQFKA